MENKVLPFRLPASSGRCGVFSYRCEYPSMTCAKQRGHDGQHYNEEGLWVVQMGERGLLINEATHSTRTPAKIKPWDGGMMGHRMPPMIKLVKTKP